MKLRRIAFFAALWICTLAAAAGSAVCAYDVARSSAVAVPPKADRASLALWSYAANYSSLEWRVSTVDGRVCAKPIAANEHALTAERPAFVVDVDGFQDASKFARVDDGWLVGFNHGEFGAALYWFSLDGKRHHRMSENQIDPQVVDFFPLGAGWGAIEGLDHLTISQGSIVRIVRDAPRGQWRVQKLVSLPAAPYTIAVPRRGPVLVVLSDGLVAFDGVNRVDRLIADAPWEGLVPNSATLSPDERTLYIGMRQYVAEFDLRTRKLRMLLPPGATLHRLSRTEEQQIRAAYGR